MKSCLLALVVSGMTTATFWDGQAFAQQIGSSALPYTEREYRYKTIFGADATPDEYWDSYWDWYDNTYRPYYLESRYRSHTRRPEVDYSDRYPADRPEFHDYYIDQGRTNRLRSPSYYYPSTGPDARLYNWR